MRLDEVRVHEQLTFCGQARKSDLANTDNPHKMERHLPEFSMIARILLLWTSRLLRSRHSAIAADVDLILKALKESSSHDQTTKEESEPSNRVEASAEAQEAQAQLFQTYKE